MLSEQVAATLELETIAVGAIWGVSGLARARAGELLRLNALGQSRRDFRVFVAPLPQVLNLDGLLGLDFFRDTRLNIDFRSNTVAVG